MSEEQKHYGTFQGIPSHHLHPPQQQGVPSYHLHPSQQQQQQQHQQQHFPSSPFGFPQPIPPSGVFAPSAPPLYSHGYQTVRGYAVVEGRPIAIIERPLPCCGIGIGWFLFVIGFFFAGFPWYVGTLALMCCHVDYREKPGFVACTIAAFLAVFAVFLGVTKGTESW